MSKAIIEIEKPKRCKDCVWYQADPWFGGSCTQAKEENGWNKHIGADEEYNVQNWCPLRLYQETIPIEWILNYRKNNRGEITYYSIDAIDHMLSEWCEVSNIDMWDMIDRWEKENE